MCGRTNGADNIYVVDGCAPGAAALLLRVEFKPTRTHTHTPKIMRFFHELSSNPHAHTHTPKIIRKPRTKRLTISPLRSSPMTTPVVLMLPLLTATDSLPPAPTKSLKQSEQFTPRISKNEKVMWYLVVASMEVANGPDNGVVPKEEESKEREGEREVDQGKVTASTSAHTGVPFKQAYEWHQRALTLCRAGLDQTMRLPSIA
jgi:hypothetical protein